MSRREEKSSTHPNAFTAEYFEEVRRRDHHPATPEAGFAGPWRVVPLFADGPPRWAVYGAGERRPRMTFNPSYSSPGRSESRWQKELLDRRLAEAEDHPDDWVSWEEAKQRLQRLVSPGQ